MKRTTKPASKFDSAPWLALDAAKNTFGRERSGKLEAVAAMARGLNMSSRDAEAFWHQWNDAANA